MTTNIFNFIKSKNNNINFNIHNIKEFITKKNANIEKVNSDINYFFSNVYFPKITKILIEKNKTQVEKNNNEYLMFKTYENIEYKNFRNLEELLLENYIDSDFKETKNIQSIESFLEEETFNFIHDIFFEKNNKKNYEKINQIYQYLFKYIYPLKIKDIFFLYNKNTEIEKYKLLKINALNEKKINLLKNKLSIILKKALTKKNITIHIIGEYTYTSINSEKVKELYDFDFSKLLVEDLLERFQDSEIKILFEEHNIISCNNKHINFISGIKSNKLKFKICEEKDIGCNFKKSESIKYKFKSFNFHL